MAAVPALVLVFQLICVTCAVCSKAVSLAELAEQCERYDDMLKHVKKVCGGCACDFRAGPGRCSSSLTDLACVG